MLRLGIFLAMPTLNAAIAPARFVSTISTSALICTRIAITTVNSEPCRDCRAHRTGPLSIQRLCGLMTAGLLVLSANAADGPAILIQAPSDRLAFGGEQVLLQAQADGTGPLQWQWLRNGAAIPGANQPTLMLPSVAEADDDTSFSVTVSNFLGTATSSNALLSVRPGILLS